jgi:Ca-activated chloride channel family protein
MGAVRLTIAFDPLTIVPQVRQVRWFANGRLVCTADVPPFSCDWDAGEMVNEHVIRAVAVLKEGRTLVANVRTKAVEFAEAVDVDVVQVTAVVTDAEGRFVTGLKAGDFKVYEDDKLQTLTNFADENIPLELVAAIDVSSSMTAVLPDVKRHATNFLAQLRATDQVTVLGFNDNIFTLARRSTDQAARARAIDRLAPWGGTALYDVIVHALGILGRQSGRRSLLVFSDGEDMLSRATAASVLQRAEASDATIYIIGQGRALKAPALQKLMRQLATGSGGRAFFTNEDTKLESIFQEIVQDLRHQYLLGYAAPDNARNGEWHKIRVEVPGRGHQVRARLGYRLARRNPQ